MGNSPSNSIIIVLLFVFINYGDSLIAPYPLHAGLRIYHSNRPINRLKEKSELRLLSSKDGNNKKDSSTPSSRPPSKIPPYFTGSFANISSTSKNSQKTSTQDSILKKSKQVAPTIDSDLLRFLSLQKKVPLIPLSLEEKIDEPNNLDNISQINSGLYQLSDTILNEKNANKNEETLITVSEQNSNDVTQSIDILELTTQSDLGNKWIDQFQAEKITQILRRHGSLREESRLAGIAVQNHAYIRMRKRSINRFLKNRDELWATYKMISASSPSFIGQKNDLNKVNATTLDQQKSSGGSDSRQSDKSSSNNNVEEVISVMLNAGLTATDCAAILTHTPNIAMMRPGRKIEGTSTDNDIKKEKSDGVTLEETLDRAYSGILFNTLKLKKSDARKVLRTCPGLLTKRGSHGGENMIKLLSSLGASPASLARDKRALPVLLARSATSLFRLVAFLSSDKVRMPVKNIGPLIRSPRCAELLDAVCSVSFSPDESELENNSLNILPRTQKDLKDEERRNEIYQKMKETAEVLRYEIGVSSLSKVVQSYPSILLLDPMTQIFPVTDFLYNELGISEFGVPQVIQSYPSILKTDIKQMRQTVQYLLELEVSDDLIGKIFRAFPAILTFDKETQIIPVVNFLREIGVVNIGRFIARLPAILGYSVEDDLKPKWGYLSQVCGFDYFEVVRFPAYFSYPLERITSRYEYLGSKGIPLRLVNVDTVLRFGDDDFATTVAGDNDNGKSFRAYVRERRSKTRKTKNKSSERRQNTAKRNGPNPRKKGIVTPEQIQGMNQTNVIDR